MKRVLPILLVLCLLLVCLVACGPKEQETQTETAEVNVPTKPTTTAPLTDGISKEDDGWSFWSQF
ncbi:MAG: hypothetical protein II776_03065 [Clostridia bacterium]|nr:hypothetical protein [Clostridia bacterium]